MVTIDEKSKENKKVFSSIIAYAVRNSIEDMHAQGIIPQSRMQEFNTNVRDAIYSTLLIMERANLGDEEALEIFNFLHISLPTYWEEPKEVSL